VKYGTGLMKLANSVTQCVLTVKRRSDSDFW